MNPERGPGAPEAHEADENSFKEMDALLADGWMFKGTINDFQPDQRFHSVLGKGEEKKVFVTGRPYPEMIDSVGDRKSGD